MRKVLFITPHGVTRNGISQSRALVNGIWIYGGFMEVKNKYDQEKQAHQKRQRDKKKGCAS